MAAGFFAKLLSLGKKIGSTVLKVVDKAKELGAKAIQTGFPIIEKIPVIGTAATVFKPAIDYMAENKGRTMFTPPLELLTRRLVD